ncbi:MAG: hypothetical protein PHR47_01995 [Candidatus Pacebacteria bacterium]|nr:hypothetical protein [Candidatus Paceibacterota bacterium]
MVFLSGGDVLKFEPKKLLIISIKELRKIFTVHPEWFETPKPKSAKGKNEIDYSIT